ncbi:MAG: hypothetical protein AAF804_06645, partial [Bacteroidota bacterium]
PSVKQGRNNLPWEKATLSMKSMISFEEVVESQGRKKISFEKLYSHVDDSESDYSVGDLLAALN